MQTVVWSPEKPIAAQLGCWCELAAEPGVVRAVFAGDAAAEHLEWHRIEGWTRTRAVTVADIRSSLGHAALDVALCSDLVYLRTGVELRPGQGEATPGFLWALGRAGRSALARGLLDAAPIGAGDAVRIGIAQGVLEPGVEVPVATRGSSLALTVARDLMRSSPAARSALELASFRLLFATGHPGEGAAAFLERRRPKFD